MATTTGSIHTAIKKQGTLSASRSAYMQRNVEIFGSKALLSASSTISALTNQPNESQPKSEVVVVGETPNGFGKQVLWHPNDAQLALVAFLNAGDPLGVMISGIRASDSIEFVSSSGIASFAEETKNKGVGSFIGIIAAGASLTASVFGAPELAPVIGVAAKFAQSQFEEQKVKTKPRDPFGENPSNGNKGRQEGGVIVSLPQARQIYYSGDDDHKGRWIKEPGTRDFAHYPNHVKNGAFFLQSGNRNMYTFGTGGDIIIAPWDFVFTDNFGFYRLHILLKRGNANTLLPSNKFKIEVTTGNIKNAGTDAKIYVTLLGDRANSHENRLDTPDNDFEQGQTNIFYIATPQNLGNLTQVRIRHDNSGNKPGWFLERIVITNMDTEKRWTFNAHRWLATGDGDGAINICLSPN